MRDERDIRPLGQTLGSAALGLGLGLGILGIGFLVSRMALPDGSIVAASTGAPSPTPVATTPPAPTRVTPAPTTAPPAMPTPTPAPTADPMVVTAYSGQGIQLAALTIPAGYTVTSPIGGTVSIDVYQYIGGEIRTGANAAGEPSFPYIFVRSASREVKIRPAAIDRDIQLLVKDGDIITAGAPLFKTITTAPSSWATFYDRTVTAQVMVSITARPSGVEVDPVPVFRR